MLRDGFEGALYSNSAAVTRPLSYCGRCVTPDKEHASCSPVDGCGGSVNNGDASTGFAVQSRAFVPADKMIVAPHAWPRASSAACGAEDGAVSEVTERSALAPNLSMTERNDADGEVAANFHVRGPTSLACLADRKDECGAGLGAGAIPVIPSTTAAVTTEDGARYPHCPIFIPSKGRSDFERGTVTLLVRELIPFTVVVEAPEAEGYIQFIDQLVVRFYGISGMTYGGTAIDDDDDAITETEDYAVEGAIGPEGERRKASQDGARGGEKREAAEPVGGACAAKAYAHTGRSPHSDDVLSASASTSECGARNGRSSTSLCGGGPVGQTARAHVAGEAPHGVRVEPAADGSGAKHVHPHARVDLSLADTETAAMTDANPYLANIRALYHHGYVFHPHRAGPHSSRRLASCARPPRRRDHGGVEEGHVCEADSLSLGTEDVENGRRHGTRCHACTGTGSQVAGAHAISTSAMIHTSPSATAGDAAAHGLHEEEEEQEDTEEMDVRVLHTAAAVRDLFCVEVLPESGMGVSYVRNYILQVLVPGMMIEHCIDVDGHVDEVGLFSPGEHATLHENALRSLQLDPAVYRALEQSHAATRVASAQPPHIFYGFYWVLDDDIGAFYRSDASGKRNCRVSTRAMLREVGTRLSEMRRRALAAGKRSYHASSCASGHGRGGSGMR